MTDQHSSRAAVHDTTRIGMNNVTTFRLRKGACRRRGGDSYAWSCKFGSGRLRCRRSWCSWAAVADPGAGARDDHREPVAGNEGPDGHRASGHATADHQHQPTEPDAGSRHSDHPLPALLQGGQVQAPRELRIVCTATSFDPFEGALLIFGKRHHTTRLTSNSAHRRRLAVQKPCRSCYQSGTHRPHDENTRRCNPVDWRKAGNLLRQALISVDPDGRLVAVSG